MTRTVNSLPQSPHTSLPERNDDSAIRQLTAEDNRIRVRNLALPLVLELCGALDRQRVSYCQWKGHHKLQRWARGEGDIDLLVARADAPSFLGVLSQLGFKEAVAPPGRQIPGLTSYYGFDAKAKQFVHIHVHYQLLLGHYLTLNYHLPIEKPFLESAAPGDLFRVPAPEFEYLVFVLRMVLEHSAAGALAEKLNTPPAMPSTELNYLETRLNRAKLCGILREHVPFIDAAAFAACEQSLRPDCPRWRRLAIKRLLQRRLKAHARRSPATDALRRLACRVINRLQVRIKGRLCRTRLAGGGVVIALVGGDGAGKSTAAIELSAWLGKKFDTKRFHLGKPPRSLLTYGVVAARRAAVLVGKMFGLQPVDDPLTGGGAPVFPGYLWLLRSLCIARDRYRLYTKVRRFAANGGVVVCDRYPLPQIKLMDGPNIDQVVRSTRTTRLAALLGRREEAYYQHFLPADLLIVLRVNPEVAVRRKTDEDPAHVRTRSQEIWELDWQGTRAYALDAGRPRHDVLSDLQLLVWNEL